MTISEAIPGTAPDLPRQQAHNTTPGRHGVGTEPDLDQVPRLVVGIELLGQYQGSGYRQASFLVRRADGQTVQMSQLLYQVLTAIDGQRDISGVAEAAATTSGLPISAENVSYLLEQKLRPLGLLASDQQLAAPTAQPLLALRGHGTVLTSRAAKAAGLALRPLFRPPVLAAILATVLVLDYWVFFVHGLGDALNQLLVDPPAMLLLVGLTLASALFHECGHAAACRYGGARTGRIGFGVYLIWPAFFTDVTDSYRLSRAGRLRTDLGGLYFNAIFILGLAGAYAATGAEVLLLAVAVGHYAMLEQLLPFVRFDGYFILSDLVGVPDLFGRVTPILRGILPSGRTDPRLAGLHRGARVVITIWVACVIPLLVGGAGYIILHLPKLEAKFWHNIWQQTQELREATRSGNYALALVDLVNVAVLALVIGGTLLIFAILASRVVRWMARWIAGRPRRQASAAVTGVVMCVGIATYWTVTGQFAAW